MVMRMTFLGSDMIWYDRSYGSEKEAIFLINIPDEELGRLQSIQG